MILSSLLQASANFLIHMADAAARSLVLGCMAALALNVFRVKNVSVRLNVWRAVLCVALIMPFSGALLPALTFRLPAQAAQQFERLRFASGAGSAVANKEAGNQKQFANLARNSRDRHVSHSYANTVPESRETTGSATAVASNAGALHLPNEDRGSSFSRAIGRAKSLLGAMPWIAIAAAAYLLVALGFLVRFALGLILSVRLERLAQRVHDPRALALLSSRARSLGIKRIPRDRKSVV